MRSTISRESRAFSIASAAFSANWEMKSLSCMEKATTSPFSFLALMSCRTPTISLSLVLRGTPRMDCVR